MISPELHPLSRLRILYQYPSFAVCQCKCGMLSVQKNCRLKIVKSCGCWQKDHPTVILKHGYRRTGTSKPEYNVWDAMKQRCLNTNCVNYENYGARGITVCERWINSFAAFIEDVGPRPSDKHSLDRINNNGNYEPSNVRWATRDIQNSNRRSYSRYAGNLNITKAAETSGIPYQTVWSRLKAGWSEEKAISTPLRKDSRRK